MFKTKQYFFLLSICIFLLLQTVLMKLVFFENFMLESLFLKIFQLVFFLFKKNTNKKQRKNIVLVLNCAISVSKNSSKFIVSEIYSVNNLEKVTEICIKPCCSRNDLLYTSVSINRDFKKKWNFVFYQIYMRSLYLFQRKKIKPVITSYNVFLFENHET